MENLRITIVQEDLKWEDTEANLQLFSEKIKALKEATDLIVLPEMFTTGFSMNAEPQPPRSRDPPQVHLAVVKFAVWTCRVSSNRND